MDVGPGAYGVVVTDEQTVTDGEKTVTAEADEPSIILTSYLSSSDEVIEQVRAAATLGLGVRLQNYLTPSGDQDGSYEEAWMFELLQGPPLRDEDDEE